MNKNMYQKTTDSSIAAETGQPEFISFFIILTVEDNYAAK